jgi:hypothetical protein
MKRITILIMAAWTLAVALMIAQTLLPKSSAAAQAPKARQQWEYASLVFGDTALDLHWQAGKTTLVSPGNVKKPDPDRSINALYQQLGGKQEATTLGALLDLIGQDGWELVTYAHPPGAQSWMFKRPSQ